MSGDMHGSLDGSKQFRSTYRIIRDIYLVADALSSFQNASWNINTLKVYRKQTLSTIVSAAKGDSYPAILQVTLAGIVLPMLALLVA